MEEKALELKALLRTLSGTDPDNKDALEELPIALKVAANMAEELYIMIVDPKE